VSHTTGHWRLDPHGCGDSPAIVRVFPCGDSEPIAVPINSGFAHLQLMSSAPDLLAALSGIFGHAERTDAADLAELWGRMDDIRNLARAAISKATGGAA
jgi:hypothetical protein